MWPGHRKSLSKSCGSPIFCILWHFVLNSAKNLKLKKWNSSRQQWTPETEIDHRQRATASGHQEFLERPLKTRAYVEWFVNCGRRFALGRAHLSGYKPGKKKKKKSLGVISRHFMYYCWRPLTVQHYCWLLTISNFTTKEYPLPAVTR